MAELWAKVLFREFIKHYRKMTPEQIVRDVQQSMDDLEELAEDTDTFGSKMVRWCKERIAENHEQRAEAGRKSGAARAAKKAAVTTARNSGRFANKEEFIQWAVDNGLDPDDAGECWNATAERGGRDKDGNKVLSIKAYATQWCRKRAENRMKKEGGA